MRSKAHSVWHLRQAAWRRLSTHPAAVLVPLLALVLRLHRTSPEFHSADGADVPALVMRVLCGGASAWDGFVQLATFRLGAVMPLVTFVHAWLAAALGTNLDASSWAYPTLTASAAGVLMSYVLVNEISGKTAATASALLLAVSPIHIMLGRHLGAPWAFEIGFQLTLLWLSIRLAKQPTSTLGAAFYGLAALYVWCGNQMAALFPVLAYTIYIGYRTQSGATLQHYLQTRLGSKWLWVFLGSLSLLSFVTFGQRAGHMAHALFHKRSTFGLHIGNWHADAVADLGYLPVYLGLLAIATCIYLARAGGWERVIVAYWLCFTLPFWFLLGPGSTLTTGYVVYGLTALLLAIPIACQRVLGGRACIWLSTATGLVLLLGSLGAVHRHYRPLAWVGAEPFQGTYKPALGASAAAAYVKRLSKAEQSVFSDASGGSGLEPSVMRVYFRRPFLAHQNAKRERPYKAYATRAGQLGFLVTRPQSEALVHEFFPGFGLRARVTNAKGRELLGLYSRGKFDTVEQLSAEEGVANYDATYPTICSQ